MINRQKGMVLLTTLMILTLLAMLLLSQMQMVFLSDKSFNQILMRHRALYQLEAEANKLILNESWRGNPTCIIKEKNPNVLIQLLKNNQGCSLIHDKKLFFYVIEALGLFPCLKTVVDARTYSTEHWRISILAKENNSSFLQLRIARLANLAACEQGELTQIKTGLISWRYLSEGI